MSVPNIWATTLRITIIERGSAFTKKLMKEKKFSGYISHNVTNRPFKTIGEGEYRQSLGSKQLQRVHSDKKSLFDGDFCMGAGFERLSASKGGGYRIVIGLYTGNKVAKDNLIAKAQLGDPFTQDPEKVEVSGLMYRTGLCLFGKELGVDGIEKIDVETLLEDPKKK
ncbi:hypothetical protein C0995_011657 [Termitomyces sp. Mi166|nr:hypothetical protein C0995_011657 [Termitomyces sp. Mi166\